MTDRIPPQALDVERTVLGSMLVDKKSCATAFSILSGEAFYSEANKQIFESMKHLFAKSQPIDMISVSNELQKCGKIDSIGGAAYISELASSIAVYENLEYYSGILLEKQKRREIIECSTNAVNACFAEDDYSAEEISSGLISRLLQGPGEASGEIKRVGEFLSAEFDRLHEICSSGKPAAFIDTGIRTIDENLIIEQHDYIIIGARPSNGKSSLAGCIARNLGKQGKTVLKLTLDSTARNEVSRDLFSESRVNLHEFNRGFGSKKDLEKLQYGSGQLYEMPVYIDDPGRITPSQIYAKALQTKYKAGNLHCVIFDYIQLADPDTKKLKRNEQVSEVSRALKALPKLIGCPVIALSQLARYQDEEKNPPTLRMLKESGDLEADVNIAILLYSPERYDTNAEPNLLKFIIAKNKNGVIGTFNLNFFKEYFLITDRDNNHKDPCCYQNV